MREQGDVSEGVCVSPHLAPPILTVPSGQLAVTNKDGGQV